MDDRNPARLAAPLALLAVAVAVAVVVQTSGSGSPSSTRPSATGTTVTQPARHERAAPRAYVVKAGDTLTIISDKTGVSLDSIQQLNPDVDANALQTGQRLKLSP